MLTLYTGLPGAGKTLNLLFELDQERQKEIAANKKDPKVQVRPIYYNGIPELNREGWIHFENPQQWATLPAGAKLVVDEAQKYFPVRKKDDAPDYITQFSTHRHLGIDVYFITQDPMLVDVWLRRLVNRHCHVVRPYGVPLSRIFEWQKVTDISEPGAKRQALVRSRPFPKHVFSWYKSADLHTQQARPPWFKLGGIAAAGVLAVALVVFAVNKIANFDEAATGKELQEAATALNEAAGTTAAAAATVAKAAETLAGLMQQFKPAAPGLPWSAPFYGEMVKPAVMPYLSGCARIQTEQADICTCNDQQGSAVPAPTEVCVAFLKGGNFDWSGQKAADDAQLVASLNSRVGGAGGLQVGSGRSEMPSMATNSAAASGLPALSP